MTTQSYIETITGNQVKREYKQFTIDEAGYWFYEGDVVYYKRFGLSKTNAIFILNRDDGPAISKANGTQLWFKNGILYRPDGPAAEYPDGKKVWVIFNREPLTERLLQTRKQPFAWSDDTNYFFDDEESWLKKLEELKRR